MAGGVARRNTSRRGRRRHAPIAEINVTPFVDVMLVLLILFMVAAPLLTVGVPLQLPQTATEVPAGELVPRLRAVAAERQSSRIYLRADGAVAYARVMEVMGALNAAGFRDIVLVTDSGGPRMDG